MEQSATVPWRHSLGRRFIINILLFSSVVTLGSTAVQLFYEYQRDLQNIDSNLRLIEHSHLRSLAEGLWSFNERFLQTQLQGILDLPDMRYLELRKDNQALLTAGHQVSGKTIRHEFPLHYSHRGLEQNLGSLMVVVGLDGVWQRLWDRVTVILVTQGVKTSLVSGFIYILFHFMVGRHLTSMASHAKTIDVNRLDRSLALSRTTKPAATDELSMVVSALNELQDRLRSGLDEINGSNRIFQALSQDTAGLVGQDLFEAIIRILCELLQADCALLGELADADTIKVQAMIVDGTMKRDGSFSLAGSPWAGLNSLKDFSLVPEGARSSFPLDTGQAPLNIEGYVWVPLLGTGGEFRGTLCVISRRRIDPPSRLEDIMRIFQARASAELERMRAEEERDAIRRQYHTQLEETVAQRTAELSLARNAAEAANRAKTVFLANMSHELRTPLNAVIGFSVLMNNDPAATEEQRKYLGIIHHSGEHLLNLIDNVLDISKIEAGRLVLEEADFDLHQMVRELHSLLHAKAQAKGLSFMVELSEGQPRHVTCDQGKLRQVLINLVGNAVKYTNRGGVVLRTALGLGEKAGRSWLRFEIQDSGPGIRPEEQERLFQPFVQVGERPQTEASTGLGLTISKQFVELMGGQIGIDSVPGQGSVFHFAIPVGIPIVPEAPPLPEHCRVTSLVAGQPLYRILIADDQPENLLLIEKLLSPVGFDLRTAANGQQAVAIAAEWQPHLIWMDIRMPVMDGLEAASRIKASENGRRIPIIALTAHALEEERRMILAAGCDDLVRKPFREHEIFEAMTRHLGLQYEYEKLPAPESEPEGVLVPEQLADLPADLVSRLRQAVLELDVAHTEEVIGEIGRLDIPLATALETLARELKYRTLSDLLGGMDEVLAGNQKMRNKDE